MWHWNNSHILFEFDNLKAELLLECLNTIKEYKDTLLENQNKGLEIPSIPLIMAAFNVKTTDDYLLEIIKRIRSR